MPQTRRLEDEVAGAEHERRSLFLVDQLRLTGQAADQLQTDSMVVDPILDRASRGGADVAGDPSAAESRGDQIAVEQARATPMKWRLGKAGVDEGGLGRRDGGRSRSAHLDDHPGRPKVTSGRQRAAGGKGELDPVPLRAIELKPQTVAGHQRLGRIVGGGDLLQAKAETLQERDRLVQRIRGDPHRSGEGLIGAVHSTVPRGKRAR